MTWETETRIFYVNLILRLRYTIWRLEDCLKSAEEKKDSLRLALKSLMQDYVVNADFKDLRQNKSETLVAN